MTRGRVGDGGGPWIRGPCRRGWRPTHRGWLARSTGWSWRRRPGPVTTQATRGLRRHGRVAGDALLEVGGRGVDVRRVAHGRVDRNADGGGREGLDRPVREPEAHRYRRGLLQYKRGHKYLVVVVDHDTGSLVWARAGRDKKTLEAFFTLVGEKRCEAIRLVSADGPGWIRDVVN